MVFDCLRFYVTVVVQYIYIYFNDFGLIVATLRWVIRALFGIT